MGRHVGVVVLVGGDDLFRRDACAARLDREAFLDERLERVEEHDAGIERMRRERSVLFAPGLADDAEGRDSVRDMFGHVGMRGAVSARERGRHLPVPLRRAVPAPGIADHQRGVGAARVNGERKTAVAPRKPHRASHLMVELKIGHVQDAVLGVRAGPPHHSEWPARALVQRNAGLEA